MKFFLTVLLGFCIIISKAQKSEIVIDSLDNKATIFSKSLLWATKTWKSANDVIQMKDENSGVIVVKGALASIMKYTGLYSMVGVQTLLTTTTVTISTKDGKAKIEFDNTKYGIQSYDNPEGTYRKGSLNRTYLKWKDSVDREQLELIEAYKKALLTKPADF